MTERDNILAEVGSLAQLQEARVADKEHFKHIEAELQAQCSALMQERDALRGEEIDPSALNAVADSIEAEMAEARKAAEEAAALQQAALLQAQAMAQPLVSRLVHFFPAASLMILNSRKSTRIL